MANASESETRPLRKTPKMVNSDHHTVVSIVINGRLIQTTRKLAQLASFPWRKVTARVNLRRAEVTKSRPDGRDVVRDRRKFRLIPGTELIYLGQDSKEYKKPSAIDKYHHIFQVVNSMTDERTSCPPDCKCTKRRSDVYIDCVEVSNTYTLCGPYHVVNFGWTHRFTYPGKQGMPFDLPLVCLDIDGHLLWIESAFVNSVNWGGEEPFKGFPVGERCCCCIDGTNIRCAGLTKSKTSSTSLLLAENCSEAEGSTLCPVCGKIRLPLNIISAAETRQQQVQQKPQLSQRGRETSVPPLLQACNIPSTSGEGLKTSPDASPEISPILAAEGRCFADSAELPLKRARVAGLPPISELFLQCVCSEEQNKQIAIKNTVGLLGSPAAECVSRSHSGRKRKWSISMLVSDD